MEIFLPLYASLKETLSMLTLNVAKNGDVQDKLRSEITKALNSSMDGHLDYDRVMQSPYLEAVIKESMRLNPNVTRLRRVCRLDDEINDNVIDLANNIEIYARDRVDISLVGVHTSEQFYDQPFRFNPQRFMPQNGKQPKNNAFLGFGIGSQICFGNRFAFVVMKTFLAQMIVKYQFKCPDILTQHQLNYCENIEINIKCENWKSKFELIAN